MGYPSALTASRTSNFYNAELDDEIPAALFSAVAQVLAYVFRLRAGQAAYQDTQSIEHIDVPLR